MEEGGLWTRLIAGSAYGAGAAVKTQSPMFFAHHALAAGASVTLPADYAERAAYVVSGAVEADGRKFGHGRMLVFAEGADARLRALEPTVLMGLGGEPLGERFIEWNFVSSSKERIEQAKADWRAGRMKLPDLDDQEFIPLPDDPPPPAPPMS
jgi:redox-sensitive bicupin YhaK (pirin superfamily)